MVGGLWPFPKGFLTKPTRVGRDGVFFVPQRPYLLQGSLREQIIYPDTPETQALSDTDLVRILHEVDLRHLLDRHMDDVRVNPRECNPCGRRRETRHSKKKKKQQQPKKDRAARSHADEWHPVMTSAEEDEADEEAVERATLSDGAGVAGAGEYATVEDALDPWDRQARVLDAHADWENMLSGGEAQRLGFARLLYHRPRYAILDEATSALDVPLEERCMMLCNELRITCISVGHRPTLLRFHKNMLVLDGHGGFRMVYDIARYVDGATEGGEAKEE